ncbi:RNA polymerase sigma factor [Microbacterium sp. NPDC056569]|uniref:RNA polymerase sigma factor n=1 Tax=Microbacterium sp. NPDC056569 TaxID=3345867 RepID=UPI00367020E5
MNELDGDDWQRVLGGDASALDPLFARHAQRLFRQASRHVSVREDAKDAVVIAFYELWRRRSQVRLVDGSPLPWLLNAVTNSARNLERSARRYRNLLESAGRDLDRGVSDPPESEPAVMAALDRLTARERSVVVLTLIEGYSERDTANALGIPVGTVKSRLARAKGRLRGELAHLVEA